ncbi:MAG: flavodoxin family protein [Lachnospiraceae bacterium]|nr:flavodoxin family protein [Lachnospiraceae bacterium]
MHIVVINGSPRGTKSNTYRLTKSFLSGMQEAVGEALQVEEIQVNAMDIKPCLGCFSCWNKTPGQCCIRDDMKQVIEKLLWADVTIWSFPLYYFSVPGGLKNLIDRQLPMVLPFMTENTDQTGSGSHPSRYDMGGKKTVVISTCGFYSAEKNYDGVCSLFDHMCGRGQYTTIFCGQGELFRVPELSKRTDGYLGYVRQAGKEYGKGEIRLETREKLGKLLYPKEVFEEMADASWGIDRESGEKQSEALGFTRQMAALYQKESYSGRERVLEMYYTDQDECYQVVLGREGSQVLSGSPRLADTRIETPLEVWRSIGAGKIRGDEALMKHLYRVTGDFSLMLEWDTYFGGPKEEEEGGISQEGEKSAKETWGGIHMPTRETNMSLLLLPWIAFWAVVPVNHRLGSLLGLLLCGLLPLLFHRNKKTLYDSVSGGLVACFSGAVLLGVPYEAMLLLSYFSFGAMWTLTCLGRIPLTAHYSMNQYQGEKALSNPIFMKTNRILTLLWGILYLITPLWTSVFLKTEWGSWSGAVNSLLPVAMGIFTAWFQKWYPAKVARG